MTDLATGSLARFYDYGQAAAERGEPLSACPCRRANRRYAWAAGWHAVNDRRLRLAREARLATRQAAPLPRERRAVNACLVRVHLYDRAKQKVRPRRVKKRLQRFKRTPTEQGPAKKGPRPKPGTGGDRPATSRRIAASRPIKEEALSAP